MSKDYLSLLPIELKLHIITSYLDAPSLAHLSSLSRAWWWAIASVDASRAWRKFCEEEGWPYGPKEEVGWMCEVEKYWNEEDGVRLAGEDKYFRRSGDEKKEKAKRNSDIISESKTTTTATTITTMTSEDERSPPSPPLREIDIPWKTRFRRLKQSSTLYGRGSMRITRSVGRNCVTGSMQYCGPLTVHAFSDHTLSVWETASGRQRCRLLGHAGIVTAVQAHSNVITSGSKDRTARAWDMSTGVPRGRWVVPSAPSIVRHDARRVIVGEESGDIRVFALGRERFVEPEVVLEEEREAPSVPEVLLAGHSAEILEMVFDRDDKLASSSLDNTIRIWRLKTGICMHVLDHFPSPALCLHLSYVDTMRDDDTKPTTESDPNTEDRLKLKPSTKPNPLYLAAGFVDGSVRAWNAQDGSLIGECMASSSTPTSSLESIIPVVDTASMITAASATTSTSRTRTRTPNALASAVHCLQVIETVSDGLFDLASARRKSDRGVADGESSLSSVSSSASVFLVAAGTSDGHIHVMDLCNPRRPSISNPSSSSSTPTVPPAISSTEPPSSSTPANSSSLSSSFVNTPLISVQAHTSPLYCLEVLAPGRKLDALEREEAAFGLSRDVGVPLTDAADEGTSTEKADVCSVGLDGTRRYWSMERGGECTRVESNAGSNLLALVGYASFIQTSVRLS